MFSGEESIRLRSKLSGEEIETFIEDALDPLGRVEFLRRGSFEVRARRFETSFATAEIHGRLVKGRNEGEWRLIVNFTVRPSALCWVLAILGLIFTIFGVLILLVPQSTKNDVEREVARAIRDARDDIEDRENLTSPYA